MLVAACAPAGAGGLGGKTVDLTHPFNAKTVYWPTSPSGFTLTVLSHGPTPAGFFYAANSFAAPEHGGTHLDAPIHFADGKWTADLVPLDRLMAPAVVIDISTRAASDRDALLLAADVEDFERRHGAIAKGTIVLVRTGWAARYPDRRSYLGDDTPGDASKLHFPGISPDAARALVTRGVAAVGIDTASIDNGPSKTFETHQVLMGANVPAFENVAAMDEVPARGAFVVALPMKIEGGTGAPLRIVAIVP
jgi:kynurenine formamidase